MPPPPGLEPVLGWMTRASKATVITRAQPTGHRMGTALEVVLVERFFEAVRPPAPTPCSARRPALRSALRALLCAV